MGWLSGAVVKNLILIGIMAGAAFTVYSMYRSVVGLEIENKKLAMDVEVAVDSIEAIGRQATMQAARAVKLDSKLRQVKQTLAIAESRILDRDLTKTVKDDPEKAAQALQEEINALFTEIETLANTAY